MPMKKNALAQGWGEREWGGVGVTKMRIIILTT